MVKPDPKHDYYADLELPATADADTIKKQFRLLAKQYHPDRNPGKEIDVIAKFQAIQAAHEILGDASQKKRYDSDRASLNSTQNGPTTYTYKKAGKPAAPPPPPSEFPPPPKRDPNLNRPFNARRPASASAEKFAQFARAAPQWQKAQDDNVRAETLRNFNKMRPQSQGPPPQVPPRAAPTAPKQPSTPAPNMSQSSGPYPGYPGLSRTNSGRRTGYAPGTSNNGNDEPSASASAYAHVHRSDRPPPTTSNSNYPYTPNMAKAGMATSPPTQRARPSMSPLRTSKSSGFEDVQRPGLSRSSSRYAKHGGERTDINGPGPGLTRSASVRNSPTGTRWDESGPFGSRPQPQQQAGFKVPPPRHHSSSPRGRSGTSGFQYSGSETSSSEGEPIPADKRPKATPRRPQAQHASSSRANGPALTGQFPNSNYNTQIHDDKQYNYPAPERKTPYQRDSFDANNPVDDITQGLNKSGIRHTRRDEVPPSNQSSYRPNGGVSESQNAANNANGTFSAAEWDGKFAAGDNVFRPTEPNSRSRSPTKPGKPKLPSRTRGGARNPNENGDDSQVNNENTANFPGVRHVSGTASGLNKAAAFQAGKFSAEDWAQRLRSQSHGSVPNASSHENSAPPTTSRQPQVHEEVEVEEHPSSPEPSRHANLSPDAMDVDESASHQPPPVAAGGVHHNSHSINHQRSPGGVDMSELKNTAPFKPSDTGLGDMGDVNAALPFNSQAAEQINLHQAPSSGPAAHKLGLPSPPKPIAPPDEFSLTQESWSAYAKKMTKYMSDWNVFYCKMMDHFRIRLQQINLSMYHNWITAMGEGASADDFDGLDFVGPEGGRVDRPDGEDGAHNKPKKAGYKTYMEWLKQDRVCRIWWEVAFDEHTKCMEDLGRVRKMVKAIRARETGDNA